MSALPQINPGGNLFNKGGSAMGSFDYSKKESRSSYNVGAKKKNRAPPPPTGLGQYKPKIFTTDTTTDVPVHDTDDSPVPPPRPSRGRDARNSAGSSDVGGAKPIVMGDKDVPMVFPTHQDPQDVALNVSSLNLTSHDVLDGGQEGGTDNPLFSMQDENSSIPYPANSSLSSNNPLFNMQDESSVAPHHADSSLSDVYDQSLSSPQPSHNPLFNTQDDSDSVPRHRLHSGVGDTEKTEDGEDVYIPAPDYDEEELTMAIPEEPEEEEDNKSRRSTQVFKEYDGEDFGQYLSDEDNDPEEILRRLSRPNIHMNGKAKTEVRRPQAKKREPLPMKNKKDKKASGYSSLRTFSYADSKFGTVSGKKGEGRFQVAKEPEQILDTGTSYEDFLYSKSGGDLSSVHRYRQEVSAESTGQSRDTVSKKRPWKVKKQTNSFDLTASS